MDDRNFRHCLRILAAAARHDGDGGLLEKRAAQGTADQARDAVSDESEAMFMSRARGSMGAEEARYRLNCHVMRSVFPSDALLRRPSLRGRRRAACRSVGDDQIAEFWMPVAAVVD